MQKNITSQFSLDFLYKPSDLLFESRRDLPTISKLYSKLSEINKQLPSGGGEIERRAIQSANSVNESKCFSDAANATSDISSTKVNEKIKQKMIESGRESPRILRLHQVIERVGLSRSSIYKFIKDGKFPKQISLGERAIGFYQHEIDHWINELVGAR